MSRSTGGMVTVILTGFLLCLFSCTTESCLEETEATVKASLYSYTTGKNTAPDSLSLYGMNMDTNLIYNKQRNVTIIKFPMNAASDSSVFIMKINGISDTIIFKHFSYPHLISKECGYTFYHEIISDPIASNNAIDSISTRKSTITTVNEENIRIFY